MRQRSYAHGGGDGPDDAAYDGSDAPHAVKGAHNASAVEKLHAHGLRVQRNIEHIVAETEKDKRREQPKTIRSHSQRHQRCRHDAHAQRNGTAASDMPHKPGCGSDGEKLAHRRAEQYAAKLNIGKRQSAFDVRNAYRPGREEYPHDEEKMHEGHAVIRFGRMRQNRCEHMVHCLNILKTFLLPC